MKIKEIVKPVVVLVCICLVVTGALAYVNSVTQPIITKAEQDKAAEARKQVLPTADDFTEIKSKLPQGVLDAYKANNGKGYVFTVSEKGYGGEIKLICGINADGSISDISTLTHSETSGIGSRVVDNSNGYSKNYKGKSVKDYEGVDAVSGATISSKAYKKAVGDALAAYDDVKEAK
jgi:electron transport complex protein RnfG